MLFLSKEIKQKIKQMEKEIIYEEKKKREVLNRNLDYDYLQKLINECDNNPDLVITLYLKNGEKMIIQTKKSRNSAYDGDYYDGEPSVSEMEIK